MSKRARARRGHEQAQDEPPEVAEAFAELAEPDHKDKRPLNEVDAALKAWTDRELGELKQRRSEKT